MERHIVEAVNLLLHALKATIKDAVKEALTEFFSHYPLPPDPTQVNYNRTDEKSHTQPSEPQPEPQDNEQQTKPQPEPNLNVNAQPSLIEPEPRTLIDFETIKDFIRAMTPEALRMWVGNSPSLIAFLGTLGIDASKVDKETLVEVIKVGLEEGLLDPADLKVDIAIEELPDIKDDPIGWIIATGKTKDKDFDWDGIKSLIESAYNIIKDRCQIEPDMFLDILLSLDTTKRIEFITDLATADVSPMLASNAEKILARYGIKVKFCPNLSEETFTDFESKVMKRWGRECGLGSDEVEERIFGYMNETFKVEFPEDEVLGDDGDDETFADEETIEVANAIIQDDKEEEDDEPDTLTEAANKLREELVKLAGTVLKPGWENWSFERLEKEAVKLKQVVMEREDLRELAEQAGLL